MVIDHAEHPGIILLNADSSEVERYEDTQKILFNFILLGIVLLCVHTWQPLPCWSLLGFLKHSSFADYWCVVLTVISVWRKLSSKSSK